MGSFSIWHWLVVLLVVLLLFGSGKISEMPEQFQERAKEFDANKDGTLDEGERQKMFEDFRNRFRGGEGGGRGGQGGGQGGRAGDNGA